MNTILGIPDPNNYGDPLNELGIDELLDLYIQEHRTAKQKLRPHWDFRIGDSGRGLYSWALPKAQLPDPGNKNLAVQTQVHSHAYGPWEGTIAKGYGAGIVKSVEKGKVLVTNIGPNYISFTTMHAKLPKRFTLIKVKDDRNWLMVNTTPTKFPGKDKPKFKLLEDTDLDSAINSALEVQEKIDGAHAVFSVDKDGKLDIFSVRTRKTGEPIFYTEKLGLHNVRMPAKYKDSVLRGEVYFVDKNGHSIPLNKVSGLLNSIPLRTMEELKKLGYSPRFALFDTERWQGQDVSSLPYKDRKANLTEALQFLPTDRFHLPASAETELDIRKLLDDIRNKTNTRTQEGVIIHTPKGIAKYKIRPENTVYFRGLYPGEGKRKNLAGGILASIQPGQDPTIRLGTGFTDVELQDFVKNYNQYVDKPFRLYHRGFNADTTKFREPSWGGWEPE